MVDPPAHPAPVASFGTSALMFGSWRHLGLVWDEDVEAVNLDTLMLGQG